MTEYVDRKNHEGTPIASLIEERERDPRKAKALERARRKLALVLDSEGDTSLAQLRLSKGLSQAKLADLMGVKQPYIARIERGDDDVKVSTISNLARALNEIPSVIFDIIESSRTQRAEGT